VNRKPNLYWRCLAEFFWAKKGSLSNYDGLQFAFIYFYTWNAMLLFPIVLFVVGYRDFNGIDPIHSVLPFLREHVYSELFSNLVVGSKRYNSVSLGMDLALPTIVVLVIHSILFYSNKDRKRHLIYLKSSVSWKYRLTVFLPGLLYFCISCVVLLILALKYNPR